MLVVSVLDRGGADFKYKSRVVLQMQKTAKKGCRCAPSGPKSMKSLASRFISSSMTMLMSLNLFSSSSTSATRFLSELYLEYIWMADRLTSNSFLELLCKTNRHTHTHTNTTHTHTQSQKWGSTRYSEYRALHLVKLNLPLHPWIHVKRWNRSWRLFHDFLNKTTIDDYCS